jgi:acyl homoserine lactone synthase
MIKIVQAADLYRRPILAASMFKDRAAQFHDRLQWEAIRLDDKGLEFDQYDELNPIYVIIEDEDGQHCGSGRLMPTTGRTMIKEHFSHLTGGVELESSLIWEVTRLCVSPRLPVGSSLARRAPAALFYAGFDMALRAGVEFFVAIYFGHMQRVWRAIGATPEVLGTMDTPDGEICAGIWEVTEKTRDLLARRAGCLVEGGPTYFPSADRFPFELNGAATQPMVPVRERLAA